MSSISSSSEMRSDSSQTSIDTDEEPDNMESSILGLPKKGVEQSTAALEQHRAIGLLASAIESNPLYTYSVLNVDKKKKRAINNRSVGTD